MAKVTLHPSACTHSGDGTNYTHNDEAKAYDGSVSTYAFFKKTQKYPNPGTAVSTYDGFPDATYASESSVNLFVDVWDWYCKFATNRSLHMEYTVDGGSNWIDVYDFSLVDGGGSTQRFGPFDCSAASPRSNIRVRARLTNGASASPFYDVTLYLAEIYLEVTYVAARFRADITGL